jgi:hypothetical protein
VSAQKNVHSCEGLFDAVICHHYYIVVIITFVIIITLSSATSLFWTVTVRKGFPLSRNYSFTLEKRSRNGTHKNNEKRQGTCYQQYNTTIYHHHHHCHRPLTGTMSTFLEPYKKPTRPLTAYNIFFHDQRQIIQEETMRTTGSKAHFTEVTKIVGSRWRKLGQEDRLHYKKLAAKDKQRYAVELVQWKISQEKAEAQGEQPVPPTIPPTIQVRSPPQYIQNTPSERFAQNMSIERHRQGPEFIQTPAQARVAPRDNPTLVQKLQTLLSFMDQIKMQHPQPLPEAKKASSQFPTYARAYNPIRKKAPAPTNGSQGFDQQDIRFLEDTFGIQQE